MTDDRWVPKHNRWLMAMVVMLGTFTELLGLLMVSITVPQIAGYLATRMEEAVWVTASYIAASVFIWPVAVLLGRWIGWRRFYLSSLAIFTFGSLLCVIAPTMRFLLIARVLQGIGGGGLAPAGQAVLTRAFAGRRQWPVFVVYVLLILVAFVLGPRLGGWLVDNYHWRWVFLINLPVGLVLLVLSGWVLKDWLKERTHTERWGSLSFMTLLSVLARLFLLRFTLLAWLERG